MKQIKLTLKELDTARNCYNSEMLEPSLDEYLSNQIGFQDDKEFTLKVNGLKTKKEQEQFEYLLHHFYENKVELLFNQDKKSDWRRPFLLILGIVLIFISQLFSIAVVSEVLLVAGWVAIWEMVDDILFREDTRRSEIKIAKILSTISMEFEK